ncbi:MAG: hypothetical protein ACWA40_10985 [Planktomarina sp.]
MGEWWDGVKAATAGLEGFDVRIGLIITFLGAIPFIWGKIWARYQVGSLKDELMDPPSWPHFAEEYRQKATLGHRFLDAVHRVGVWATAFYRFEAGSNRPTWRTYGRCLQIAFLYPILALVIAWVFGSAGTLGEVELLKTDMPFSQRLGLAAALVSGMGIFATTYWQPYYDNSWFRKN